MNCLGESEFDSQIKQLLTRLFLSVTDRLFRLTLVLEMNMSICKKYRLISPMPAILMSNLYGHCKCLIIEIKKKTLKKGSIARLKQRERKQNQREEKVQS